MKVETVIRKASERCQNCSALARYDITVAEGFLQLCPICFGELLRKAVAVASEMV
jgi:rRNA maturation endonuclease Nob1